MPRPVEFIRCELRAAEHALEVHEARVRALRDEYVRVAERFRCSICHAAYVENGGDICAACRLNS